MSERPGPAGPPPGVAGSEEPGPQVEQFTVPVPASAPLAGAPATQALPVAEPTRELPVAPPPMGVPPVPQSPYAVPPAPQQPDVRAWAGDESVDPLLGQIGVALFWVVIGWWLFFVVRLLGWVVRFGATDTIVIRTIDLGAEETVAAAVLSVLAALLLLLGRGRAGRRSPLGIASAVLALLTVGIAVWRLLP